VAVSSSAALLRLLEAGAQSVVEVLGKSAGAPVVRGDVRIVEAAEALATLPLPGVVVRAQVAGGTACLAMTLAAAQALGAEAEQPTSPQTAVDGLTAGASSALERAVAALVGSTESLLGEVAGGLPIDVVVVDGDWPEPAAADAPVGAAALMLAGEPALVLLSVSAPQLEQSVSLFPASGADDPEPAGPVISDAALRPVRVRLWAELGRARMPLGRAVALAPGAVVELDAAVDDPVDILVNGIRLGRGSLVVGDDAKWALRIDEIVARSEVNESR
jgi:flagellar motor switch protein FliN/FliY